MKAKIVTWGIVVLGIRHPLFCLTFNVICEKVTHFPVTLNNLHLKKQHENHGRFEFDSGLFAILCKEWIETKLFKNIPDCVLRNFNETLISLAKKKQLKKTVTIM